MSAYWDDCEHEWTEDTSDHDICKDGYTQVVCKKCGVPGEQTDATGEVYWPTT